MGCFPSKPEAPKGLEPSTITHQTQIPIHPLHDAEAESVVFTAGRPSFGFNQLPPSMRGRPSMDQPRAQAGMGYSRGASIDHPRPQAGTGLPRGTSVDIARQSSEKTPTTRPIQPLKRPDFHRARSLGPISPAMSTGNGNKLKVSFAAHVLQRSQMKEIPLDGDSPPMTAPPTREQF